MLRGERARGTLTTHTNSAFLSIDLVFLHFRDIMTNVVDQGHVFGTGFATKDAGKGLPRDFPAVGVNLFQGKRIFAHSILSILSPHAGGRFLSFSVYFSFCDHEKWYPWPQYYTILHIREVALIAKEEGVA